MTSHVRSLTGCILIALSIAALGCRSAPKGEGAKTAERLQSLAASVNSGEARLQETLTALSNMVESPSSLPAQFKAYDRALDRLDKQAKRVNSAARSMANEVDRYMKEWSEEVAKIQNEDIRSRSDARRQQVDAQLTALRNDYQALSESFKPVMASFEDIHTALKADLTVAGVKAISAEAEKANALAEKVVENAAKVSDDLEAVGVQMAGGA
jgi:chromosome segregation ATPase